MRSLALAILMIISGPHAESKNPSPFVELNKMSAPNNDCKRLQAELSSIIVTEGNDKIVPGAKVPFALKQVRDLGEQTSDISQLILDGFAEDPEKAYHELNRLASGECSVAVFQIFKALIGSAVGSHSTVSDRDAVDSGLRKWLGRNKVPTLMTASTDLALVESAVEKGLWKATPSQKKEIADERAQLLLEIAAVNKGLYGTEHPNSDGASIPTPTDFKKIQTSLVKEVKVSTHQIQQLRTFVSSLP